MENKSLSNSAEGGSFVDNHNTKTELVFVYGTLMRGRSNNYYLRDEVYAGEAVIEGYDLFDLGGFPGIVAGQGIVVGELWRVDPKTLLYGLDRLEGYSEWRDTGHYLRREIPITILLADGNEAQVSAWVYIYNGVVRLTERNLRPSGIKWHR